MPQLSFNSPVGPLTLAEEAGAIVSLDWGYVPDPTETALLVEARAQLDGYFDGRVTRFTLPLRPEGTGFQKRLWAAMCDIPYGQTRSYGALAAAVGKPAATRAVGAACGRNPIPIIIPCHRVLAAGGGLGGYSAPDGVETKIQLLALEGVLL